MSAPKATAAGAGDKPRGITTEQFRNWTRDCRVRRIQQKHMELVREAEAAGISPDELLRQKGYRDFLDFHSKECPKFNLTCSTSQLGELGVGFVLYFRLMRWLALVLFLLGLLQIPIMVTYGNSDLHAWWRYYTDWRRGYEMDGGSRCACLGGNRGVQGPSGAFAAPQYGASCGAWDVDACLAAASPFASPGKWCCRSWCFADPLCKESDDSSSPSLSARWYKGMVRVTASCQQNATLLAERCGSLPDVAFGEFERLNLGSFAANFISIWWLTPGALGPDEASQTHILVMYVLCVIFLCLCIISYRQFQIRTIREVDIQSVTPNDFAIMVKGLPPTMTDEGTIADFFRANAVEGKDSVEIVKVVIGWAPDGAYREKMKELKRARAVLQRKQTGGLRCCGCRCQSDVAEDEDTLQQRILDIKRSIFEHAPGASEKLLSSGTVVVVFRRQPDLQLCLERWSGFWQRWSYCRPAAGGMWRGEPLPTFGEEKLQLQVRRAANPGDIHWEELGHGSFHQKRLWVMTSFAMLVLIVAGFMLSWLLNNWQTNLKAGLDETKVSSRLLSILPAVVIAIINLLLRVAGRIFGDLEYQETWGQQEFSQGVKMFWSMLINTACVVLFINAQPQEWYRKGGLVDDVFYMLIVDSIGARICLFFDITYTFNYVYRKSLTEKKLEAMNETIVQNHLRKTPEQAEAIENLIREVDGYKWAFEPEEIDNPDRYARLLVTFLCSVFFAPVFPAAVFIGMAGLLLQYALDKVLLLRWYKRPRPQNDVQAIWSLHMLKVLAPLALSAGMFIFLMPSWNDKRQVLNMSIVCLSISLVLAIFPSRILAWLNIFGFIFRCCSRRREDPAPHWEDYYNAQYMWPKEMKYHMDQPLYKQLNKVWKEKNPAILKPGEDHCIPAADLKAHYFGCIKSSVAKAAPRRHGQRGRPPRRGSVGVPALEGGSRLSTGAGGKGSSEAEAISIAAVTPIMLESTMWMFEAEGGYKVYADDCQAYIESGYQAFLQDSSRSRVTVETVGTTLLLDFEKMTQKLKDGHRERAIQRLVPSAAEPPFVSV